jgi:hypothetical protein
VIIDVATNPTTLASSVKITSDPTGCTFAANSDFSQQTATCTGTYSDTTKFTFTAKTDTATGADRAWRACLLGGIIVFFAAFWAGRLLLGFI